MSGSHQWLEAAQKMRPHNTLFQIHFFVGAMAGEYLAFMSLRGALLCIATNCPDGPSSDALLNPHDSSGRRDRPHDERGRRSLSDVAMFGGSHYLVARNEALAPEPDRNLGSTFRAHQLGPS
jgi:hypothetical protein